MSPRARTLLLSALALVVVAGIAVGGWAIVDSRANDSGRSLAPAPSPTASPTGGPTASPSPSQTRTPLPPREKEFWLVAMLRRSIPVYDKPSVDARVRM